MPNEMYQSGINRSEILSVNIWTVSKAYSPSRVPGTLFLHCAYVYI